MQVELFAKEEYGIIPDGWISKSRLISEDFFENKVRKIYEICIEYQGKISSFRFVLWKPCDIKGNVPATILISCHNKVKSEIHQQAMQNMETMLPMLETMLGSKEKLEIMLSDKTDTGRGVLDIECDVDDMYWPVEKIIERGFATAAFYADDLAKDQQGEWWKQGIAKLLVSDKEYPERPGCIALWAFGASRVLDVLLKEEGICRERISVCGHSRGGKAALWAAVQDKRFETVFVNNAGCCGSALNKGKIGENISSILHMADRWFCPAFQKYSVVKVEEMPFDQDDLLACMAPRPLYVASGSTDFWSDPNAEFAACKSASKAWEKYGLDGLVCENEPRENMVYHEGKIGYHLRKGGHALTVEDWMYFLDYCEKLKPNETVLES